MYIPFIQKTRLLRKPFRHSKRFDCLNDMLTAPWDVMYGYAKEFFEQNGHLDVPKKYKTSDGYSLGTWLMTQRRVYAGDISGRLTERQVGQLNAIGMRWEDKSEITWKQGYDLFWSIRRNMVIWIFP